MADNIALRTVSPNQAKNSIRRAFKKKRPIFIWGPPGIGKSEVVHQIGNEYKKSLVITLFMSLQCPRNLHY